MQSITGKVTISDLISSASKTEGLKAVQQLLVSSKSKCFILLGDQVSRHPQVRSIV